MTTIVSGPGDREAHGFGSHAMRFHEKNISLDAASDAPGPGSYGIQPAFHEESGANASIGVKGTGGFASRSRRFRPVPLRGPGPGNYDQDVQPTKPHPSEGSRQSAVFAQPTSFNPQKTQAQPSPGPGAYKAKESANSARATDGVRDVSSVFHEGKNESRDPFRPVDPNKPGPGHYSARSSSTPPGASARSSFTGPIPRPLVSVKPGLPITTMKAADTAGDFVRKVGAPPLEVPGPGQYDIEREIESRKHFNTLGTGAFQRGASHQPRKWQAPGPGPAEYKNSVVPTLDGAKSSFNSCSNRTDFTGAGKAAPGPAFYSPRPKKGVESFHLNIRRKWV